MSITRKAIQQVWEETLDQSLDGEAMAELVFQRISPVQYADVLRELLPGVVYDFVRQPSRRNDAESDLGGSIPDSTASKEAAHPTNTPSAPSRQDRLAGVDIRLYDQVRGVNGMVMLKDATAKDLRHAAELRRAQARTLSASASKFEGLANELDDAGASMVQHLPFEKVEAYL